jgi:hypothetical protein
VPAIMIRLNTRHRPVMTVSSTNFVAFPQKFSPVSVSFFQSGLWGS